MFTGLIESVATVARISRSGGGARLGVTGIRWPHGDSPRHGDSIAVNGVCLTAIDPHEGDFDADLSPVVGRDRAEHHAGIGSPERARAVHLGGPASEYDSFLGTGYPSGRCESKNEAANPLHDRGDGPL